MVLTVLIAAQPALCVTPHDILIVYNENMAGSKQVAQHYATKRNVPENNMIGVFLPDSETVKRSTFENNLCAKLKEPVRTLKRDGRQPVILLTYGIPLRTTGKNGSDSDALARLAEEKITEIGSFVAKLTERLEKAIASYEKRPNAEPGSSPPSHDVGDILKRSRDTVKRATEIKQSSGQVQISPDAAQEIAAIVFRLTGIAPFAGAALQETKTNGPENGFRKTDLLKWAMIIDGRLAHVPFQGVTENNAYDTASLVRVSRGLIGELDFWHGIEGINIDDQVSASVDSELTMLLVPSFNKARWLPNPFLDQFDTIPGIDAIRNQRIMVARLDGPSPEIAMRLVDDAVWTEDHGLKGVFYIDARGLNPNQKDNFYATYDEHLRKLHRILAEKSSMKVVLDDKPELFPERCCPDAALYTGWYSLANYVDSFTWQRGAVGFHIASAEAKTLRKPDSQVWCKKMLEKGIAATLGPVQEPYLQSFPLPDIFFPLLMTGKLPLVEVYYRSTPFLSWRQILIGDPLYTPFLKEPALQPE